MKASVPDREAVIDYIISSTSMTPQAAEACIDWLASQPAGSRAARPRFVAAWLARALMPSTSMPPEDLHWRVEASRRCRAVLPHHTWAAVYEACGSWLANPCREGAQPAAILPAKNLPDDLPPELRFVLARCWIEIGENERAVAVLSELQRVERFAADARWGKRTVVRRAAPQGANSEAASTTRPPLNPPARKNRT